MERRKFLIGAGALASGSAAAVGTGAFTTASATRSVNIDTAGDQSASLQLEPTAGQNSTYTSLDGEDTVKVDLDSVNRDGKTNILELFEIQNAGTQDVVLYVEPGSGVTPSEVTVPLPNEQSSRDFPAPGDGSGNVYIDPQASGMPNEDRPFSLTGTYGSSIPEDIAAYESLGDIGDEPSESLAGTSLYDRTLATGDTGYFGLNIQHEAPADFPDDISVTIKAVDVDKL